MTDFSPRELVAQADSETAGRITEQLQELRADPELPPELLIEVESLLQELNKRFPDEISNHLHRNCNDTL